MSLNVTILGCGPSGGVPRIGGSWGACDPANPRNRRRRGGLLVARKGPGGWTRILVDTPPDLRAQLLDAEVGRLDAVLYTHDHADHTHGIDDLRTVAQNQGRRIDVYFDAATARSIESRFAYLFRRPKGSTYPPVLRSHIIRPLEPLEITGAGGPIAVLPFLQDHGRLHSLGFRFGALAYSTDASGFPPESLPALEGLDVWILGALKYEPHPTHFSVEEALDWIARMGPRRAYLVHLSTALDYDALCRALPPQVRPAHDGLALTVDARALPASAVARAAP